MKGFSIEVGGGAVQNFYKEPISAVNNDPVLES